MKDLKEYLKESLVTNSPSFLNEDRDETINSISKKLSHLLISEDRNETIRLNDFEACWTVKDPVNHGGSFFIQVPKDYSDDDINQYVSDCMLEGMPSDEDLAKEYFGTNADHIIDARFEFEEKKEGSTDKHLTLKFESDKDDIYKGTNDDLTIYELKNLRFIIDFEYFDVTNTSDDGLQYDLWDVFKRTKSSSNVKYLDGKVILDISEKDLKFDNGKSELVKK